MINLDDLNLKQAVRNFVALLLVCAFGLAGCQGQSFLDAIFPQAESQLGNNLPAPTIEADQEEVSTPTPQDPIFFELELWIPPQFDPNAESEASNLLNERIREFLIQNPQVNLNVRVKALTGPGSMMDSLTGANAVAPEVLPSLVLLNRSDLVAAANRGLIFPIEEFSSSVDESDWYDFAQELAIYQGSAFGLPFASNALAILYRRNSLSSDQPSWDEALRRLDFLVFPAGDADALVTMALYSSAGGTLEPQMGQVAIDPDALTTALEIIDRARRAGVVRRETIDYQTDDQAWEAFLNNGNSDGIITWANRLFNSEEELGLALLPPLGESPLTFGTGWSWCLAEEDVQKRELAAALAEYLSAPEFLSRWAPVSGFLPVRPSSLDGFSGEGLQSTLSTLLLSTRMRPDRQALSEISLQIEAAVSEVINGTQTAEESVENVLTRLEGSENQ